KGAYEMYYDYQETIRSLASHRILAVSRAEREGSVKVTIVADEEKLVEYVEEQMIKPQANEVEKESLKAAVEDSYQRLIQPSIEREIRSSLTEKAEIQAIEVFSENLKNLLLQPPLKGRTILGV